MAIILREHVLAWCEQCDKILCKACHPGPACRAYGRGHLIVTEHSFVKFWEHEEGT